MGARGRRERFYDNAAFHDDARHNITSTPTPTRIRSNGPKKLRDFAGAVGFVVVVVVDSVVSVAGSDVATVAVVSVVVVVAGSTDDVVSVAG